MARLNTRTSTLSTASSRYASATPQPHIDQENIDPEERAGGDKRLQAAMQEPAAATLPTPPSAEDESRGQKRKRNTARPEAQPTTTALTQEEQEFTRYFDPYQDANVRRDIKKRARELDRDFRDRRGELLQDNGSALADTVKTANALYTEVKQTGDATLDSRLLVDVSDLAYKRSAALTLGSSNSGIDIDEFISKAISYMRNQSAEQAASTQSRSRVRPRRAAVEEDDEEDTLESTDLDWEFLGRHVCYANNNRPPVRSFLLGPLSLEKKQRAHTQRRARNANANIQEAKPQAITRDDLTQSDANSLTAQCAAIRRQLRRHIKNAVVALRQAGITDEDVGSERAQHIMRDLGLCHVDGNVGAPLLKYVVNPHSFSQTVENIFYASFLIKEGSAGIGFDEDDMPVFFPSDPRSIEQHRAEKISKQQAVISIDYGTWKALIEAYNITEPMIPHREEEQAQLSARGWYG